MRKLFTAKTANDSTKANVFQASGATRLSVHAFGTWGTGTIGVYLSLNGTANGVLLTELTFTANGFKAIDVAGGTNIWAETSGFSGGESLNLWIAGTGVD